MATLKQQIAVLINDNTTSDITPKDVRDSFNLTVDAVDINKAAITAHETHTHMGSQVNVMSPQSGHLENLQQYLADEEIALQTITLLLDQQMTLGHLRALRIGHLYGFPSTPSESSPGAGDLIGFSKTEIVAIHHTGHRYTNAVILRTGVDTWTIWAEEWTGTNKQPTLEWNMDVDPAYPDNMAVGGSGATSFTSAVRDLIAEIGDSSLFGAHTIVEKIQVNENKLNVISTRIATMEGFAGAHLDIVEDFNLYINNNGQHYMILNDRPMSAGHLGKDLYDGHEHKVRLLWDNELPWSEAAPFDPAHFEDPTGSGTYHNWNSPANAPSVWLQQGVKFQHLVDPVTKAVFAYPAIWSMADKGQVLTVLWDSINSVLEVRSVEERTVHVVTSPDHMPLQKGGGVTAKSIPFIATAPADIAAINNNSLFIDNSGVLKWKDHAGAIMTVSMTT